MSYYIYLEKFDRVNALSISFSDIISFWSCFIHENIPLRINFESYSCFSFPNF